MVRYIVFKRECCTTVSAALFLVFSLTSCIVKVPSRGATDLSEQFLMPTSSSYYYKELESVGLENRLKKNDSSMVVVFAPWCPYSFSAISNGSYLRNYRQVKPYFICSNYDVESIEKKFLNLLPTDTIYFIDASTYGSLESAKTKQFLKEVTKQDSVSGGVPQHLLFVKGNCVKQSRNLQKIFD